MARSRRLLHDSSGLPAQRGLEKVLARAFFKGECVNEREKQGSARIWGLTARPQSQGCWGFAHHCLAPHAWAEPPVRPTFSQSLWLGTETARELSKDQLGSRLLLAAPTLGS